MFINIDTKGNFKKLNKNKGLTLVELMVTMAIIGILIVIAFSINSFAQKVYTKGERLSDVQYNMRMASDYITREVRFSNKVEILKASDTVPSTITNDDCYIYTKAVGSDTALKYKDKTTEKTIAEATTISILFGTNTPYKTLYFKLTGDRTGEDFELDSEVLVLNLPTNDVIIDNTGINDGVKLKFIKNSTGTMAGGLNFEPAPPNGLLNAVYNHIFTPSGVTSPYSFAVTEGSLPTGLTLDPTGTLHGTPTASGSYMFKVTLTDSSSKVSRYFEVIITDSLSSTKPIASNLVITGSTNVGSTLTANYSYFDPNSDLEENSIVNWYSEDNTSGLNKKLISTAVTTVDHPSTYVIKSADVNKYIFIEVIPRAENGETGASVFSAPTSKISSNLSPTARDVHITGSTKSGSVLTGNYLYSDADGDTEGISQFKWYRSEKKNGSKLEMIEITGANSKKYTLTSEDVDKYIYFGVTPKAVSGVLEGEIVISANVGKIYN